MCRNGIDYKIGVDSTVPGRTLIHQVHHHWKYSVRLADTGIAPVGLAHGLD